MRDDDVRVDPDSWTYDEWWRCQNPGASAARGMMIGLSVSLLLWFVIIAAVVLLVNWFS